MCALSKTSRQCAIGCELKISSRIAVSCAHVRGQLCRISESRILQKIGAADTFCDGRHLVRRDDKHEPDVVGALVHIQRRVCRIFSVVLRGELRLAKRGLNRDAGGPDAFG